MSDLFGRLNKARADAKRLRGLGVIITADGGVEPAISISSESRVDNPVKFYDLYSGCIDKGEDAPAENKP